ncbi:two-component signal transduction sensor histidine kinase [[Clostridium] sordellii]|uniref:sensor histidine kinase n=1 Tax=Paraclostridium sordellii TaxID=1505 RepID=UPI0005DEE3D4|nr:sensor histidine kinase [Paeniclostridium sordellii]CEN23322.1 two-component signal transduction sensor histidine kinase [[Clostridium] sordellii] [Paeniclostridium sordellii]
MIDRYYNEFWLLFNFISVFIFSLTFKKILNNLSTRRSSDFINNTTLLILTVIGFVFNKNIKFFLPIIGVIYITINYNLKLIKSIIFSFTYWGILCILIDKLSLKLIFYINTFDVLNIENQSIDIVIIETFILKIILLGLTLFIFTYIKKLKGKGDILNYFIFIPILTNLFSLIIIYRLIAVNYKLSSFNILILGIASGLILASNIYFIMLIKKLVYSYTIKYENKLMKENILKEYNHYLCIKREQDKVKEVYHDIKNHMICIRDMSVNSNTKGIINYIDSIQQKYNKYSEFNNTYDTGNMIVDSILNNKKSICEKKDIDFFADVDFSKSDFIDTVDVCIIFSNIIDNAIEACEKINSIDLERSIIIKSRYIDNFCIISIENTKNDDTVIQNGKIKTTKKDSFTHGLGLKNVRNTVKKYLGEVSINYTDNKFNLKIMIPL